MSTEKKPSVTKKDFLKAYINITVLTIVGGLVFYYVVSSLIVIK